MAAEPQDLAGNEAAAALAPAPAVTPTPPTPIRPATARPRTGVKTKRETRPQRRARLEREAAARGDSDDTDDGPKPATRRSGTTGAERRRNAARVPQSKWMAGAMGYLGRQFERAGADPLAPEGNPFMPFGRALQFNAPIAGAAFDDAVRGTWFDRRAQPMLARGDKWRTFGNAAGFPVMIFAMQAKPEMYEFIAPMAFEMFEANIEAMVPVIESKITKEKATQKIIDKAVDEGMLPQYRDDNTGQVRNPTALDLFEAFFAPPARQPEPEPEPTADDE